MKAFVVADDRITGEVVALVDVQVGLQVAFMVAQTRAGHAWPRLPDGQHALNVVAFVGVRHLLPRQWV